MSYARSPREVCSTTMGTRTECPILPPNVMGPAINRPELLRSLGSDRLSGLALLCQRQRLFLLLQRLGQIGDRILAQIIHDTRTEGNPAIVHRARHVVGAFAQTAGALLIRRQAVEGFDDVQQADFTGFHTESEAAGGALARS